MSCAAEVIYAGARPTVQMTFHDTDDVLADPTTITIRVKPPTGSVVEYETPIASITQASTGVWEFQFPAGLVAGKYWIHIVGAGGGADVAKEIWLTVAGVHVPAA